MSAVKSTTKRPTKRRVSAKATRANAAKKAKKKLVIGTNKVGMEKAW